MLLSEGQQDVDSAIPNPPLDPKMTHYGVRAHIESTWPEHRFSTPEIEIIGADRPNQSTSSCYGNSKPTRNRVPKNNQKRLRDTVSLDAPPSTPPDFALPKHHFREDTLIPGEQAVAPDQLNFSTSPRQHIPAKITHNSDPAKRLQTGTLHGTIKRAIIVATTSTCHHQVSICGFL